MVLVNSELTDNLEVVDLPAIPFRPSLLSVLCFSFGIFPEPRGVAGGNPGTAPSARRSTALGEAAETHSG